MSTGYAAKRKPIQRKKRPLPVPEGYDPASPERIHDEIEKRAREIYQERNGLKGDELSDWLQAENEVMLKYGPPSA